MRLANGTTLRNNCIRLATSSVVKKLTPVRFPPGWFRLATSPCVTGFPAEPNIIGIVVVAVLAASVPAPLPGIAMTVIW